MSSGGGQPQRVLLFSTLLGAVMGVAGTFVVVVAAQKPYPIYTADHFAATMETLGPNFTATMQSLDAADYPTTKQRLSRSREQLATTITFWRDHEKEDAVGFVRAALRAMDELDAVLSTESVDLGATTTAAGQIRAACASCHNLYREQDAATGEFRLKSGAVE